MRFLILITFAAVLTGNDALAQETIPAINQETNEEAWSFSASVTTYIVPDSQEIVQPTFTADQGWIHLETRYNYENLDTGSIWIGYNFAVGDKLALEATPMLGGVFGETTGHRARLQVYADLLEA